MSNTFRKLPRDNDLAVKVKNSEAVVGNVVTVEGRSGSSYCVEIVSFSHIQPRDSNYTMCLFKVGRGTKIMLEDIEWDDEE